MTTDHQRITITIDTPDMPSNDTIAVQALLEVIRQLQHDGIYPTLIRLELSPTPTTP
jgi:hypothetical protein